MSLTTSESVVNIFRGNFNTVGNTSLLVGSTECIIE